ncbi:DUF2855 family protein [Neptunicoccus sediminis]|uniref:DUF2855 family protein n=1 Tax=Neptunicoccus sediminis TaxID=1892596 RepID=UPI000845FFED|nr:DUF2855 family protein [Neptunicoccus sediminis]
MPAVTRVLTDQKTITRQKLDQSAAATLDDGQVRLAIESFALTANNVTYAATGFDIGYWKFFPVEEDGQGLVPVWGFARVVESRSEALEVGARLYGFYPMASELVITPVAHGRSAVRDTAPHRDGLPEVYNLYSRVGPAASSDPYQALMQPLIATSYLLFDWLSDNEWFGAQQIIIGSASSKTGLGLCAFLSEQVGRPYQVVGLTGDKNAEFVRELGFCDQVLTYGDVGQLDRVESVYVDMAGNATVKQALHARLDGVLKHSSAVGLSHWDQFAKSEGLAGPKPQFFFAPAQIAKRKADWGKGVIEGKITEVTAQIVADAARWLTLETHDGLEAALQPFTDLAEGRADPKTGHIVRLS